MSTQIFVNPCDSSNVNKMGTLVFDVTNPLTSNNKLQSFFFLYFI